MILYIHPKTHMQLKAILPMSLPALINRLPAPVIGRFHNEWKSEEVRQAKIVLMDIHWYLSLKSASALSHKLKRINPKLIIIIGGLSASIFAKQLLRDAAIDFIIKGDAEIPLEQLVQAMLTQAPIDKIPNLITRDFVSPTTYTLTSKDIDASDYRDISFFPTLEKQIRRYHRNYKAHITIPIYPYLMIFRGCPTHCPACYGASELQRQLFARTWVLRSADKVKADLVAWSADPHMRFVNIFHDFVTLLPQTYTQHILSQKYTLSVSYEFFGLPTKGQLAQFLDSFVGGKILFSMDQNHNTTANPVEAKTLIQRIKQVQSTGTYEAVLGYIQRFRTTPQYDAVFRNVIAQTKVATYKVDFWWEDFPIPDAQGESDEAEYQKYVAWNNKFLLMNTIYRIGIAIYRLFPAFAKTVSHWLFS